RLEVGDVVGGDLAAQLVGIEQPQQQVSAGDRSGHLRLPQATRPSLRHSFILLLSVRAVTAMRRAASVLLPPVDAGAARIASRSMSSRRRLARLGDELGASGEFAISTALGCGPNESCGESIEPPCMSTTARWIAFSSSRTLPGQLHSSSRRRASLVN